MTKIRTSLGPFCALRSQLVVHSDKLVKIQAKYHLTDPRLCRSLILQLQSNATRKCFAIIIVRRFELQT